MNVGRMTFSVILTALIYIALFTYAVFMGKKRANASRNGKGKPAAPAKGAESKKTAVKNRSVNRIRDALQKNTERGKSSLLYRNSERLTKDASMDKVVSLRKNTPEPEDDDCDFGDINHAYSHDQEQRLEQLKSFLKNGLIDKKEYQALVEKYSRQQNY